MTGEERADTLRQKGYPKSLHGLYAVMMAAIGVQILLHAFTAGAESVAPAALRRSLMAGGALGDAYRASFLTFAVVIPVGAIAWMRWLDWSVKNRFASGDTGFPRTPAEVIWAYFVPGPNAYRPRLDLCLLYQRLSGDGTPGVVTAWWIATLAHLLTMLLAEVAGLLWLRALSSWLGVLSNGLALLVLRAFFERQPYAGRAQGVAVGDKLS